MEQILIKQKLILFKKITGTSSQFVADAIKIDRSTLSRFISGQRDLPTRYINSLNIFMDSTILKLNILTDIKLNQLN